MNCKTLFSIGFRPFFLLAGLYAAFSVILWVLTYNATITPSLPWDNYTLWHGHEMLFGFVTAVIAGFLLTAIANWTGTEPIQSWKLSFLVVLWLAGRVVMNTDILSPVHIAWVDSSFLPALMLMLAPILIKSARIANMAFIVLLAILGALNIFIHLSVLEKTGINPIDILFLSVHVVMFIIAVIGGRVIPFFTQNGLKIKNIAVEINRQPIVDTLALASMLALCVVGYIENFNTPLFGAIALITAGIHTVRLSRWHGLQTLNTPILWVLHIGYTWLIIGLVLEGLHGVWNLIPLQLSMHAFTMGAMGTMILGMISRVSLGHTGRKIHAPKVIVAAYLILQVAIIVRLLGGWLLADYYMEAVIGSAVLWSVVFALFVFVYSPILVSKRYDDAEIH